MELDISQTSVQQIMKNDLEPRSYKTVIKPLLSDNQRIKSGKNLKAEFQKDFRKEETMRILFSNEKVLSHWRVSITLRMIGCGQQILLIPIQKVALSRDEYSHRK